jgi:hypothetical protein
VRQGRDADHSAPSTAEIKKDGGYTSSSPKRLSWRAAGQLYFYFHTYATSTHFSSATTCVLDNFFIILTF